jgi:phosphodiesterase/alkaline phosphatase D-like protein
MNEKKNTPCPFHGRIVSPALPGSFGFSMICLLMLASLALGNEIITLGPYIQNVTPESIVILWQTETPVASHIAFRASDQDEQYLNDPKPVTHHEATLVDLEPDTVYTYGVISDANEVVFESTFRTAPDTPRSFRFVVYGDSRTNPEAHRTVVKAIINSHPELVLHTGDLVA